LPSGPAGTSTSTYHRLFFGLREMLMRRRPVEVGRRSCAQPRWGCADSRES
jgi:hypothetical protein